MRGWWTASFVVALLGCGSSTLLETALHGDLRALKRELSAERRNGNLDEERTLELARAVAGRELRSASGPEAPARVRQTSTCGAALIPELEDRAERADDAAAEATRVLLELGRRDRSQIVRRFHEASSSRWRAVAARAAKGQQLGAQRRRFLVDPDEHVRQAAFYAAWESADPADLEIVLESARVEPDPLSRSTATRTAGAIGGSRAVFALRDLWARADPIERVAIVDAWSQPKALASGGRAQLLWVVEAESGLPALAAADALVRSGGPGSDVAVARLVQAVRDGTARERVLALQRLPRSAITPELLDKAQTNADGAVKVAALARAAELPERRDKARTSLHELARGKSDAAELARSALAFLGDERVVPQLQTQLSSSRASERRAAALNLVAMGKFVQAASALADDEPLVRLQTACSMLAQDR